MKTKLLFLLFLSTLLHVSISSFANVFVAKQIIKLKSKTSEESRSIPVPPEAFIEGSLLFIEFPPVVTSATIMVKNETTGEVVYLSSDLNADKIEFDLAEEKSGKYTLEIQLSESTFVGDFEL